MIEIEFCPHEPIIKVKAHGYASHFTQTANLKTESSLVDLHRK